MAITASGIFGLTLEKILIDAAGQSLESETAVKGLLVLDALTPNFDTMDFRDDVTANEVPATGNYTAGGNVATLTEVTLAAGVLTYDHIDATWPGSTISNAMGLVDYFNVGTAATDQLICLLDFVTAVTTANGLLTVQIAGAGVFTLDYTP